MILKDSHIKVYLRNNSKLFWYSVIVIGVYLALGIISVL